MKSENDDNPTGPTCGCELNTDFDKGQRLKQPNTSRIPGKKRRKEVKDKVTAENEPSRICRRWPAKVRRKNTA
jgi:hypothetical protein